MSEQFTGRDIISLTVSVLSLLLTIYFIKENTVKLVMITIIVLVIAFSYSLTLFKEVKENSLQIKKINEQMDIYNRLNKIEATLSVRGEKK